MSHYYYHAAMRLAIVETKHFSNCWCRVTVPSNYMQLWPSAAQHYRMAGSEQEPEDALADRCLVWSLRFATCWALSNWPGVGACCSPLGYCIVDKSEPQLAFNIIQHLFHSDLSLKVQECQDIDIKHPHTHRYIYIYKYNYICTHNMVHIICIYIYIIWYIFNI